MRESRRETDWDFTDYLAVFPNQVPYNELLLTGRLRIGRSWVYTRSWELVGFSEPFPMLLYNSRTVVKAVAGHYRHMFDASALPVGAIVGYTELAKTQELNAKEFLFLFGRFNGLSQKEAIHTIKRCFRDEAAGERDWSRPYVWPCEIGFFFSKMVRFAHPVQFAWRGRKRLSWTPLASVSAELKRAGVNPKRAALLTRKAIPEL